MEEERLGLGSHGMGGRRENRTGEPQWGGREGPGLKLGTHEMDGEGGARTGIGNPWAGWKERNGTGVSSSIEAKRCELLVAANDAIKLPHTYGDEQDAPSQNQ